MSFTDATGVRSRHRETSGFRTRNEREAGPRPDGGTATARQSDAQPVRRPNGPANGVIRVRLAGIDGQGGRCGLGLGNRPQISIVPWSLPPPTVRRRIWCREFLGQ